MRQTSITNRIRRISVALCAILYAVTLVSHAQVAFPGTIPTGIGITEANLNEYPATLQMIYAAGFRYLRTDMKWKVVETTAGVYDFTAYDTFVTNATNAGFKVMFIFDYSNTLYDGGFSPNDTTGYNAFAAFAKAAVAHYQGKGIIWEVYNEPTSFWTTSGQTLTANSDANFVAPLYSGMAVATNNLIKTSFPNELLMGPALPWTDSKSAPYFNNSLSFLSQIINAGSANNWDGISVHPYRTVAPEYAIADMATIRSTISAATTRTLPLISSEWGYTSSNWDAPVGTDSYTVAEQMKAKYVARSLLVNIIQGIPISILYNWMDSGTDQTNDEDNYGMVQPYSLSVPNPTITVLPAYNAVKTLTTQLNGLNYASQYNTGDSTDYILKFTNGSKAVWTCYNSAGTSHVVIVPLGANVPVTKTAYDGTAVTQTTSGPNGYSCTTSDGIDYLAVN